MATVLVVEDDPDITAVLTLFLQEQGHAVQTAVNGGAIPIAVAAQPAVVFVDINMPGMDGIEVARRLRADPRTQHARIVLMSAAQRLSERGHEAPVDSLLPKPFDLDHVQTLVAQLADDATPPQ
jgi:CheY-like chemotaxis protein